MKTARICTIFIICSLIATPAMAWHQGHYHAPGYSPPGSGYQRQIENIQRDSENRRERQREQQYQQENLRLQREQNRILEEQNRRDMFRGWGNK